MGLPMWPIMYIGCSTKNDKVEWDQHNAAGEGEQDAAGGEGSLGAPA